MLLVSHQQRRQSTFYTIDLFVDIAWRLALHGRMKRMISLI